MIASTDVIYLIGSLRNEKTPELARSVSDLEGYAPVEARWDVMYQFATGVVTSMEALIEALR